MNTKEAVKHTPGPWECGVGDEGEAQVYGSNGYQRIILASTENFRIATAESKANARLIAAAPDLLAALKLWKGVKDSEAWAIEEVSGLCADNYATTENDVLEKIMEERDIE